MALKKLEPALPDPRLSVAMKSDPTRVDARKVKLGKSMARHDPRTLLLASYVMPALPAPSVLRFETDFEETWGQTVVPQFFVRKWPAQCQANW
jgi:hypothetical protein